jgi:hypothetical protein
MRALARYKFPTFGGIARFLTVFTKTVYLPYPKPDEIHILTSRFFQIHFIIVKFNVLMAVTVETAARM